MVSLQTLAFRQLRNKCKRVMLRFSEDVSKLDTTFVPTRHRTRATVPTPASSMCSPENFSIASSNAASPTPPAAKSDRSGAFPNSATPTGFSNRIFFDRSSLRQQANVHNTRTVMRWALGSWRVTAVKEKRRASRQAESRAASPPIPFCGAAASLVALVRRQPPDASHLHHAIVAHSARLRHHRRSDH